MLRDLLIYHGFRNFEPKVATVTVHGCDEHCVVLCGGYICDPTAFQFGKCDAWVIVHKDDPQSVYALGGGPEYQELIERLQETNGFEIAQGNGVVNGTEVKALLTRSYHGVADIVVAKQRNGPTGKVKLTFLKDSTRFESFAEAQT